MSPIKYDVHNNWAKFIEILYMNFYPFVYREKEKHTIVFDNFVSILNSSNTIYTRNWFFIIRQ
jgi:hypothetical protein